MTVPSESAAPTGPAVGAKPGIGAEPILEVRRLTTSFPTPRGRLVAVRDVSFSLRPGQILGIVGESGSGKSALLLSILGLIRPPGRTAGQVALAGRDLTRLPARALRQLRGREVSMIFQDPMSTLNPVFPVGEQVRESMRVHGLVPGPAWWPWDKARRREERRRVWRLLEEVGIGAPERRHWQYPHEFSGGMQQRILIALALACEPKLLLADEPTTALDVTIQAQIMDLLRRINREHGTAIVLVTHDLGLAAEFCQDIAVMYAGRLVEFGPAEAVLDRPLHPYTRGLLASLPRLDGPRRRLQPIAGDVPELVDPEPGCAFAPRCPLASDACRGREIPLSPPARLAEAPADRPAAGATHLVRCVEYLRPTLERAEAAVERDAG